jgi:hypothetical protein
MLEELRADLEDTRDSYRRQLDLLAGGGQGGGA